MRLCRSRHEREAEKMRDHRSKGRDQAGPRKAAPPFRRRLVVMAKVPVAGRVKTRLARQVGSVRATSFYRHATAAVLARVQAPRAWQTLLAVTPDTGRFHRCWPPHIMRVAQGGGDLGQRMQRIMSRPLPGPVVIIGTDVPAIRPTYIGAAFAALGQYDAVLGPAHDGGYWLVGLKRRPRVMNAFRNVRWSSTHALEDTIANLAGYRVARAIALGDVDDPHQLARASSWSGRRVLPAQLSDGSSALPMDRLAGFG